MGSESSKSTPSSKSTGSSSHKQKTLSREYDGLSDDLWTVSDSSAPREKKLEAFKRIRGALAPNVSEDKSYEEAVKKVFSTRFNEWSEVKRVGLSLSPSSKLQESSTAVSGGGRDEVAITFSDRMRGCVFGMALGDAVGLATEFLSKSDIIKFYGKSYRYSPKCLCVPDSHRMSWCGGDWTDDTDQMILILQTVLEHNGNVDARAFAQRLLRWRDHGFPELGDEGGNGLGRTVKAVLDHPIFAEDPVIAAQQVWNNGGRRAAANGAVMRTAVTGLSRFWDHDKVVENTLTACTVTHADPKCQMSCLAVALVIRRLVTARVGSEQSDNDDSVDAILDDVSGEVEGMFGDDAGEAVLTDFRRHFDGGRFEDKSPSSDGNLRHYFARRLQHLRLDEPSAIGYTFKCMGSGITALRAANLSLKCGFAPDDVFRAALSAVAEEGGDADTNGAVVGAMLGALVGHRGLPSDWLQELPYFAWLEAWVQKLLFMSKLPVPIQR